MKSTSRRLFIDRLFLLAALLAASALPVMGNADGSSADPGAPDPEIRPLSMAIPEAVAPSTESGPIFLGASGPYWYESWPSTLYEIDPATGTVARTIGPIGYIVTGMEFDPSTGKLYGCTAFRDASYSGLIVIDPSTGAGTPAGVDGWGLYDTSAPPPPLPYGADPGVAMITMDSGGQMYGYWAPEDQLVSIDKTTGVATRVGATGIAPYASRLSLDFDTNDVLFLQNSDAKTYTVDPSTGAGTFYAIAPPLHAGYFNVSGGDFEPTSNLYYGLSQQWGLYVIDFHYEPPDFPRVIDLRRGDFYTYRVRELTWLSSPPTPEELIERLIGSVDELLQDGSINWGQANALRSKLESALRSLERGKEIPAINKVEAFINQVEALVRSRRLTEEQGEQLITSALGIVDSILEE